MVDENGVSEIIGAILLVSLVILGAMIVAVLFLSQPPPQEIPQVNAIAGNNTTHIFLLHDGGDPLTPLETVIRIDGRSEPVPPEDIELLREDGRVEEPSWTSGKWSVGKTLRIKDDQPPQSVSLIYSGGSSQALLLTSTFMETVSGGNGGPEPPDSWTITASAGSGGSISPSGSVQVPDGGSRSFSISPYECYSIANVVVDGSGLGAIPSYQFTNVQEDHTIQASFTVNTFYIDASVDGDGGTIDPSGNQGPYNCNDSQKFSITADPGYFIQDVVVDGDMWQGAVSTYTFDGIVSNHTIVAYFSPESGPECGTITGTKYNDLNGNGRRDPDEPGLSGWTIQAYRKEGNNWLYTTFANTLADGRYTLSGLAYHPAEQYLVKEIVQPGYQRTYPVNEDYYNFIVLNRGHCYKTGIDFGNKEIPPPQAKNTKLITNRGGYINSNGYIQFKVLGAYSVITINNILYSLPMNSEIKLVVNSDSNTADIDMNSNHISNFDLPDVSLYIGGILRETGTVSDIWISEFSNYVSTLQITVPGGGKKVGTEFVYDGNTLIKGDDHSTIRIYDLQPDSSQYLRLGIESNHIDYFGGADGYLIN